MSVKLWSERWTPYLQTFAIVGAVTLIKLFLNNVFALSSPILLYYSAVIAASWLGGARQGIFAAFLTILSTTFIIGMWSPLSPGGFDRVYFWRIGLYLVDCALIVFFAWALQRSRQRAQTALGEATFAQQSTQAAENRFFRIFESNMIGLLFTKQDGTILDANDYFLNMLGYTRDDLRSGRVTWTALTPDDQMQKSRDAFERMLKEKVLAPFEKTYIRKDGSEVPVLLGAAALDKDTSVTYVLDISERRRTETALAGAYSELEARVAQRTNELREIAENLRQSQDFLDSVIENIPNMLFVKDAKDLRFVRFNRAGEEMLGYSRADLIGKNDFDFFPKEEAEFFTAKDRKVLEGKIAVDIPEEPLSTREGLRYLHTKKIPVADKNGNPLYLLGISEDITEKKQAEQQRLTLLQEQAARAEAEKTAEQLRFLAEASASLNESLDPQIMLRGFSEIVIANLADMCVIDLLSEDRKSTLEPIIAHRDPQKIRWALDFRRRNPLDLKSDHVIAKVIRSGKPELMTAADFEFGPADIHDLKIQSVMVVPIQSFGQVLGTLTLVAAESLRNYSQLDLSIAADLARRASFAIENSRLFTKAQEASRAKSAFLANMSHEIRTPLGAMLGFTELLADEGLTPDQRQYLSTIAKNGQHLLRIVDEILDLSKVESDHVHVENIEFPIATLVSDVSGPMKMQAADKGLVFEMLVAKDVPERFVSDPTRLRQILINLIGNAIKFTEKGKVSVHVSTDPLPNYAADGKVDLRITVTDSGIGITPEQRIKLFQPFVQADNSMTRRFGGTGLGLFLSRRLAQLLGGDVVLEESRRGEGSRFLVTLNVQTRGGKAADSAVVSRAATAATAPQTTSSGRVLIVDDAPDNRTLIYLYVSRLGYQADVASNGAEAVRKALENPYDVILMDVQMPEMDGFEAVQILRKRQYANPIVALTAHTMKGDRERCLENGFNDYLGKPIDRDLLRQSLSRFTEN